MNKTRQTIKTPFVLRRHEVFAAACQTVQTENTLVGYESVAT